MYQYRDFDRQFIRLRAEQYRDQLQRRLSGQLSEEAFRPLRLQNGWYVQRYAPMLRVAVPYGELSAPQVRVLARIAREYDQPNKELFDHAVASQNRLGDIHLSNGQTIGSRLTAGYAHFTTRQNVQFNWIPLEKSADVMDLLATVDLHGIQTSGNCIRNITSDALAGIAPDEVADPRPWAEIMRQWSTLHPEFAFLPRKFKIAIHGAAEDRAATAWHDVGLQLVKNEQGELGFKVQVGGGMGRTPTIATVIREFLPAEQILNYLEAIVRVYNRWGRRDNKYKARIKILVKAEGQRYIDEVETEFKEILEHDGAQHTVTAEELARVSPNFAPPAPSVRAEPVEALTQDFDKLSPNGPSITAAELQRVSANFAPPAPSVRAEPVEALTQDVDKLSPNGPTITAAEQADYERWLARNVHAHKNPQLRAVTLSFKRLGQSPGDATAAQLDAVAELAERYSAGEVRVTHRQDLLLPWVQAEQLPALWRDAKRLGVAKANIGLLSDMIACPGGDFCDLANARSLPLAEAITQRYQDLDELDDLGEIDLHISGCINSCGHHHSGHIGILGVDKDGKEWYQVTVGGSDGSSISGAPVPGKVIGPSFSSHEVPDVIEALLGTYRELRQSGEHFIDTVRRVGIDPFKAAGQQARHPSADEEEATA